MVNDARGSGIKLEPHMIPKLRAAFQDAQRQLEEVIRDSGRSLPMTQPAMGDAASHAFQAEFNQGAASARDQLTAYQARLREVDTALGEIQAAYDRNEQAIAEDLSRKLVT